MSAAAGGALAEQPAEPACSQCGSTAHSAGVLGLQVCSDCGSVRSFDSDIKTGERPICPQRTLLRVSAAPSHRDCSRNSLASDCARAQRISRCRQAIELLSEAVQLQQSLVEPASTLLVRHCSATKGVPVRGSRLKRLVSACVLVAAARQGLGLTVHEVAAQACLPLREVQRSVWRVCKINGVRLVRGPQNVDSFLQRLCQKLQLNQQRAAVCTAAARLVTMANEGWIATGRKWVFLVAAAFIMAARAYHFEVRVESLSRVLAVQTAGIQCRLREIGQLLVSLLSALPWGHMVTPSNVHCYLLFAVDFYDVLKGALPRLKQARPAETEAEAADGPAPAAKKPRV